MGRKTKREKETKKIPTFLHFVEKEHKQLYISDITLSKTVDKSVKIPVETFFVGKCGDISNKSCTFAASIEKKHEYFYRKYRRPHG